MYMYIYKANSILFIDVKLDRRVQKVNADKWQTCIPAIEASIFISK